MLRGAYVSLQNFKKCLPEIGPVAMMAIMAPTPQQRHTANVSTGTDLDLST